MIKGSMMQRAQGENGMHCDDRETNVARVAMHVGATVQQWVNSARCRSAGVMRTPIFACIATLAVIFSTCADADGQVTINHLTLSQCTISLETTDSGDSLVVGFYTDPGFIISIFSRPRYIASGVGDDVVTVLCHFVSLKHVSLDGGEFSDEAIARLARLENIEFLSLRDSSIGDNALKDLFQLEELRELDISGNSISDIGLEHIAKLKHLQTLNLAATDITDDGLMQLSGLVELRSLEVGYTQVSAEALMRLREILPQLIISREHLNVGR